MKMFSFNDKWNNIPESQQKLKLAEIDIDLTQCIKEELPYLSDEDVKSLKHKGYMMSSGHYILESAEFTLELVDVLQRFSEEKK